jgi:hypothetical protein
VKKKINGLNSVDSRTIKMRLFLWVDYKITFDEWRGSVMFALIMVIGERVILRIGGFDANEKEVKRNDSLSGGEGLKKTFQTIIKLHPLHH